MKPVRDITEHLDPPAALAKIPAVQPVRIDPATAHLVNQVFAKLQGIFPAWRQAWPDDHALRSAKREWIGGFVQAGINSDTQLAWGFQGARRSRKDFVPSVGVFVEWCKPSAADMGLPCESDAWHQALLGQYAHAAVRIAAEATSTFDLRTAKQGDKALRQRFERNYAIVMRRAQTGQPLEGRIAKGIGHDSARPREQVQLEYSHREAERLVELQGIPRNALAARHQLLGLLRVRSHDDD